MQCIPIQGVVGIKWHYKLSQACHTGHVNGLYINAVYMHAVFRPALHNFCTYNMLCTPCVNVCLCVPFKSLNYTARKKSGPKQRVYTCIMGGVRELEGGGCKKDAFVFLRWLGGVLEAP